MKAEKAAKVAAQQEEARKKLEADDVCRYSDLHLAHGLIICPGILQTILRETPPQQVPAPSQEFPCFDSHFVIHGRSARPPPCTHTNISSDREQDGLSFAQAEDRYHSGTGACFTRQSIYCNGEVGFWLARGEYCPCSRYRAEECR